MAVISKKKLFLQEGDTYFQKSKLNNGKEIGLRFATPKDAVNISSLFKESYNYEYPYPFVYDIDLLKNDISKLNRFWILSDLLENEVTVGCALVEKERYIAHAGCLIVRKNFQRQGITTKMAAAGLITVTKMPQFKGVLRLNTEVRATLTNVQTSAQNAGAIPYSIIPSHFSLEDNRHLDVNDNNPCPSQKEKSSVLYSMIFRNLWKNREKNVFLLDNEDLVFVYEYIRSQARKMKDDTLIPKRENKNKGYELYAVSKDHHIAIVQLFGYIKEKSITNLLKTYRNWRIILWKVPTTENGVASMSLALKKGFKVVGYDIGFANIEKTLFDSIIFAYYPNSNCNLSDINCIKAIKPLFNKVKEQFFSSIN